MIKISIQEFARMSWNERMEFIKYCAEGNFTVDYGTIQIKYIGIY